MLKFIRKYILKTEKKPKDTSRLYNTDLSYNITYKLKKRYKKATGRNGKEALELLGCSIGDLIIRFQDQFTEGMSLGRILDGDLEIDHIKPIKMFDLTNKDERKKAFHFTNLQILWSSDNRSKGAKFDPTEYIPMDGIKFNKHNLKHGVYIKGELIGFYDTLTQAESRLFN